MKRNPIRTLFAAALSAVLLCMNAYAFTPENVESITEPVIQDENAALNDDAASELLFYQDFDHLEVGTYTSVENMLGGNITLANSSAASGSVFEICEEANGNKYLKVTGQTYQGFSVFFEKVGCAVISMEYKFPENNTGLVNMTRVRFNDSQWGVDGDGWKSQDLTVSTDWTALSRHTAGTNVNGVGFGFTRGTDTEYADGEIHIDNLAVYSFSVREGTAISSSVVKTVSFVNSTENAPADVTLPDPLTDKVVWCNFYGNQYNWRDKTVVNLSNYSPNSPVIPGDGYKYTFAGWSTSNGGSIVKSCQYNSFRVPGDFTFYAVWERERLKPVAMFEDFEEFEVGQVLTSANLDFLTLNQFGYDNFTATIVLDETTGSKVLKISGIGYPGFALKNRGNAAGTEYVNFDYRFGTDTTKPLAGYSGISHSDITRNLSPTTTWSCCIQSSNPTNKVFGFFFQQAPSAGLTSEIYLDNFYYWYIPAGLEQDEKKVTISFANSTKNAPTDTVLPDAVTMNLWESGLSDCELDLSKRTSDNTSGYRFLGWSRTDGGAVIPTCYNSYRAIKDETLYAVWKIDTPAMTGLTSIRTKAGEEKQAIRFQAKISGNMFVNCEEFGFLATRESLLGENELTLDLGTGKFVSKAVDKTAVTDSDKDLTWAVVLKNIPKKAKYLQEDLVVRGYVKLDGVTYYGTQAAKSIYQTAKDYAAKYPDNVPETIQEIIDMVENV